MKEGALPQYNSLSILSLLYQGNALFLTIAHYSLVNFQTAPKMTSHVTVQQDSEIEKNLDLYYLAPQVI